MFETLCAKSVALYQQGKHDAALEVLDEAIAIGSKNYDEMAVAYKNRAAILSASQRWSQAEKALVQALEHTQNKNLKVRCLLKRSYVLSALEKHEDALRDALELQRLEPSKKIIERVHQCRSILRAEKRALAFEADTARDMIHTAQRLRFFFHDKDIRLGNEFGLWRSSDWSTVVHDTTKPALVKYNSNKIFKMFTKSGHIEIDDDIDDFFRIEATGENWQRLPLALIKLPVHEQSNDVGAIYCREIGTLLLAEAQGSLGIGGKLWDASFAIIGLITTLNLQGCNLLEIGSGIGAVGLTCAKVLDARSVVLTDIAPVIPLLDLNIRLNSCTHSCKAIELDWFMPHQGIKRITSPTPDFIFMSDVVYDPTLHKPLLNTLESLFATFDPKLVLLAHRYRNPHDAHFFNELCDIYTVYSSGDEKTSQMLHDPLNEDNFLQSPQSQRGGEGENKFVLSENEIPPDIVLMRILKKKKTPSHFKEKKRNTNPIPSEDDEDLNSLLY